MVHFTASDLSDNLQKSVDLGKPGYDCGRTKAIRHEGFSAEEKGVLASHRGQERAQLPGSVSSTGCH